MLCVDEYLQLSHVEICYTSYKYYYLQTYLLYEIAPECLVVLLWWKMATENANVIENFSLNLKWPKIC